MRKFHRWITVLIAIPMLFIAITGVASQLVAIYARGGLSEPERRMPGPPPAAPAAKPQASALPALIPEAKAHEGEEHEEEASAPAPSTAPTSATIAAPAGPGSPAAGPAAPPAMPRFTPTPAQRMVGYLHHLHSGEEFGPVGTIISILSGCALIFFAISGMWMYLQMFLNRKRMGRKGVFWK
jgi:hypothetical protein